MTARIGFAVAVTTAALAFAPASAFAQGPFGPLNDLAALGQGFGDSPDTVPVQRPPAPPMDAVPRANCGPGSKREPSIQGRVPAGSATDGLWCNVEMLSHQGTSGGFKVQRYVDAAGHECAYYDTALLFPANAFNLNSSGVGVAVLDMSNPRKPVQTDTLTEPPMLSPHESVLLNQKRGLLAAVDGNPGTYPGMVSIYDVSKDCRQPVHDYTGLLAKLGHESGFSMDGKTFYATGTAYKMITAIDVTDPKAPHVVWQGNIVSHGMSLSDDGNRAYVADPTDHNMLILDTSQIQARKPDPTAKEISRITWDRASIPQNAIPFTRDGHPYVLEFDEYNEGTLNPSGNPDNVGAGRIIDIANEKSPRIVSNLRLQINQPKEHAEYGGDPGADGSTHGGAQGYAAHYCNIPTRVDPKIVACSFIASGLRLFDISDLEHPKEVGYFVAPTQTRFENGGEASDFAMSEPAFVPARHEIWFTDGTSGFYALRVTNGAWPGATSAVRGTCTTAKRKTYTLKLPRHANARRVRASLGKKRVRITRVKRSRGKVRVTVNARGLKPGKLRFRVRLTNGKTVKRSRTFKGCPAH
ncbi:MAG TPA: hypothetical protein VH247_06305 [Thermoleophilaceae bacterium]|nr:hypothetical protein [Thermoleophilaceae bacterium]